MNKHFTSVYVMSVKFDILDETLYSPWTTSMGERLSGFWYENITTELLLIVSVVV